MGFHNPPKAFLSILLVDQIKETSEIDRLASDIRFGEELQLTVAPLAGKECDSGVVPRHSCLCSRRGRLHWVLRRAGYRAQFVLCMEEGLDEMGACRNRIIHNQQWKRLLAQDHRLSHTRLVTPLSASLFP